MAELICELGCPSERQREFLSAGTRYVAYGGARGGGKTWAVRTKAVIMAGSYPRMKQLILRRTYPELYQNHIRPMRELLPSSVRYNDKEKVLSFPNGSLIFFGYCSNDNDVLRYQGQEYDIIYIDEATQFKEEWFSDLRACLRGTNGYPKRMYLTCNPGGVGHGWVRRLFIDRAYKDKEIPEQYSFIQAKVYDNTVLMESDPDYISNLESLPPARRAAWLEGRWDIYEGQYFEEFRDDPAHYEDRRYTHVIKPFEIPKSWTIYRSFDWGYSRPFSCGWWAIDYDGVLYRILELYGCTENPNEGVKWTAERVFSEIHKFETEHPWLSGRQIIGVADPAIWAADGGESIERVASRNQVFFQKGDHQRIPGWMQCHYRLQFDENGKPMMYVFENCAAFRRTVPLLQYDRHRVEDLDSSGEDHVADEWRYICMARPIAPREVPEASPWAKEPAHYALDIKPGELTARTVRAKMEVIDNG